MLFCGVSGDTKVNYRIVSTERFCIGVGFLEGTCSLPMYVDGWI